MTYEEFLTIRRQIFHDRQMRTMSKHWSWGKLKEHDQECKECAATGFWAEEQDRSESEDIEDDSDYYRCEDCDNGYVHWPSFYATETHGLCSQCKQEEMAISDVLNGEGTDDAEDWCCLPCYLRLHKEKCGCDLWRDAWVEVVASTFTCGQCKNWMEVTQAWSAERIWGRCAAPCPAWVDSCIDRGYREDKVAQDNDIATHCDCFEPKS